MQANLAHATLRTIKALGSKATYPIRQLRYAKLYQRGDLVDGSLPLIYISQLWRSGGTMLSQFFDGLPGVLAFPKELKFGVAKQEPLCLDAWCGRPAEEVRLAFVRVNGVFRDAARGSYDKASGASLPFRFDSGLFAYLFDRLWSEHPPQRGRDIAGIFFSAFFSAWIDRRPTPQPPRYISGFASFVALDPVNVGRFFAYYPDGYLIQIIREPVSWYGSVRAKSLRGSDTARPSAETHGVAHAIDFYRRQGLTLEANLRAHPGRCILLDYDRLVAEPVHHMARLCAHLGLDYSDIATKATFNGLPIGSNSSFRDTHLRRDSVLSADETVRLEREAMPIYQEALRLVAMQEAAGAR